MRRWTAAVAAGMALLGVVAAGCTSEDAGPTTASSSPPTEESGSTPEVAATAAATPSQPRGDDTHEPARARGVPVDTPDADPASVLCTAASDGDASVIETAFAQVHSDVDHVVLALYDEGRDRAAGRVRTIKQDMTGVVADHDDDRLVTVARALSDALTAATAADPSDVATC